LSAALFLHWNPSNGVPAESTVNVADAQVPFGTPCAKELSDVPLSQSASSPLGEVTGLLSRIMSSTQAHALGAKLAVVAGLMKWFAQYPPAPSACMPIHP